MRFLLVLVGIVGVALLARLAWLRWPPVARFMVKHTNARIQRAVGEYLDGKRELDAVASEMASRIKWVQSQGWEDPDPEQLPEGTGNLTAVSLLITPPGYSPSDPRLPPLEDRLLFYYWGAEKYGEIQESLRQMKKRRGPSPSP
jgi:hypothetical protein